MTALSPTVRLDPSVLQSVPSSIIPSADRAYDLGSPTSRWRSVYARNYYIRDTIWNDLDLDTLESFTIPGAVFDILAFRMPVSIELLDRATNSWRSVSDPTVYYSLFTGEWGETPWKIINNSYGGIRFTWNNIPYVWIKALWMYISPANNSFNVKLEISSNGSTWETVLYDTNLSGEPAHYVRYFGTAISTNRKPYVRLTIEFNWIGSETTVMIAGIRMFVVYDWIVKHNHIPFTADYARNIKFYGSLIPSADSAYDLGSPTSRWRSVYVATAVTGDVVFANGWRITEDGDALLFINPNGKPALKLKPDGALERLLN